MKFHKYHALGNDYLVLDPRNGALPTPKAIELICHRNFGLGSDGILYGPLRTEVADYGLQIWNPDGSEAEKSGNGLRIFTRFMLDEGLVSHDPFTVMTAGGKVTCRVHQDNEIIEVEMGRVSFNSAIIPVTGMERDVLDEELTVDGTSYRYYAATIGNPHVVLPMEAHTRKLICEIGPVIAGADKEQAEAMREFGLNLGTAFQIIDDVLDYRADQEKLGKTIGDDFREGKITAPVLYALENATDEEQAFWHRTMVERNQTGEDLAQAMKTMEKYNALNESIHLAGNYAQKAQLILARAPASEIKDQLDDLLTFTVERAH